MMASVFNGDVPRGGSVRMRDYAIRELPSSSIGGE